MKETKHSASRKPSENLQKMLWISHVNITHYCKGKITQLTSVRIRGYPVMSNSCGGKQTTASVERQNSTVHLHQSFSTIDQSIRDFFFFPKKKKKNRKHKFIQKTLNSRYSSGNQSNDMQLAKPKVQEEMGKRSVNKMWIYAQSAYLRLRGSGKERQTDDCKRRERSLGRMLIDRGTHKFAANDAERCRRRRAHQLRLPTPNLR